MRIYAILVRFDDGVQNINEGFKTFEEARERIKFKCGKGYYEFENMPYKCADLDRHILYDIKEIEVKG